MNSTYRSTVPSASTTRRAICLLGLALSCFGAASSQVQQLVVTPYSVLGTQTSLGTANTANVAVDSKDNIYYPNFYNNAIYKIDTQGNQTVVPTNGLNSPQGMRFDASDNLYLCDALNSRIVVLTPAGAQTVLPMTGLNLPQHLAFDSGYQNLYVSDRYAGILQYNLASQKTTVYATGLFRPEGIAVDAQNNVFYGDGGTLLKNKAIFSTSAGEPDALLFDPAGNLYVMASNGNGLHRIDPVGNILALADDGSNDIAIDSHGVLVMPSHNGQHMSAYLPGPAIWGGRNDAFVGGRISNNQANTIRTYYSTPAGVTLTSLAIPAAGSPYGGDNGPSCSTSTLCGANVSLGAFLPGPQPGYAVATFSDGTKTTTPLYGSGVQVEMGFSLGTTSQMITGVTQYGGAANDLNGNVYVSDTAANKVFKVTGTTATALAFNGLDHPSQLALDGTGSVYVLDSSSQRILKLDSSGKQTVAFQGTTLQSFALDGATNLYLATLNGAGTPVIQFVGANGAKSVYATPPSVPNGMAFDTFGTLYAMDAQGTLAKYDHFANRLTLATGLPAASSIAIEPSGTVYLASNTSSTLTQILPSGPAATYKVPGVTLASVVTVDNHGNLTVGDNSTHLLTFDDRTTQPYAFGSVAVQASSTLHMSLVNVGSKGGMTISSISGDGPFVLDPGTTTCIPPTTSLAAGGTCEIGFTFTPTAVQSYSGSGQVVIPLPTPNYSATGASLPLTGNGVKASPVANPGGPYRATTGAQVSFNGSASTDPGNETLTYAWNFGDNASGTGVKPTHAYKASGTYTVTLTVTNTDGLTASATTTATITDTYLASLSPATYSFGNLAVGSSATATFTLTNTGTGGFQAGTIQLAADATNSYSATNTCGTGTLASGISCTITVTLQPSAGGAIATTLAIKNAAGTQTASISGTGVVPTVTLTPAVYDFGSVAPGSTRTSIFTLTNTSSVGIGVGTIALAPESTNSYRYVTTCGATLAAGGACTLTVSFKPSAAGSSSTTLNVTDDAGHQTAAIFGTGIAPTATLTPLASDFGSVAIGSSQTRLLTLTSTGTTAISITGADSSSPVFTLSSQTCGTTLAEGDSCTYTIAYTPTAAGAASSTFAVTDTAGTQSSALSGTGLPAGSLTIAPTMQQFPASAVGTTSAVQTSTISNTTTQPIYLSSGSLTDTTDFAQSDTCNGLIAAGSTCTVVFTFMPKTTGALNSKYNIHNLNTPASALSVTLSANGTGAPVATLSPATLTFSATVNAPASNQTVTLSNSGNAALSIGSVTLGGTNPGSFSIVSQTCAATLAPNSSCTVTISFTQTAVGTANATLITTDNASPTTQTVALTGTVAGVASATLAPGALAFSTVAGTSSAAQTLTLTNTGSAALTISSISLAGSNPTLFTQATTCGATLAAAASCTISVTFKPGAVGTFTATLSVTDNAASSPQTATLTGTATAAPAPQAALTPGSASFAAVTGTTSTAQIFTLTNAGNAVLPITSASVTGSAFAITANTCGTSLAASASCTLSVTFTPALVGTATGTLSVVDSVGTQGSALTGLGSAAVVPDFTLAATPAAQSSYRGQNVPYTLQLASLLAAAPFNNPVILTATNLPVGVTASFSPASVLPGTGQATSVMTLSVPALVSRNAPEQGNTRSRKIYWSALLIGLACFRRRRRARRLPSLAALLLLAGLTLGLAGCGTGSGFGVPTSITTITVLASSGATVHTTTVSLTIQ